MNLQQKTAVALFNFWKYEIQSLPDNPSFSITEEEPNDFFVFIIENPTQTIYFSDTAAFKFGINYKRDSDENAIQDQLDNLNLIFRKSKSLKELQIDGDNYIVSNLLINDLPIYNINTITPTLNHLEVVGQNYYFSISINLRKEVSNA